MREGECVEVNYLVRQYKTGNTIKAQNENSTPIVHLGNKNVTLIKKPIRDFTGLILADLNLSKGKVTRRIF
jgi:hypothetical protein